MYILCYLLSKLSWIFNETGGKVTLLLTLWHLLKRKNGGAFIQQLSPFGSLFCYKKFWDK